MPDTPKTLEDALVALDRLQKVVDRLAERVNEIEDVKVPNIERRLVEADDIATFGLSRTDELGEDKPSRKELQGQIRLLNPGTVERVMIRGKVVARLKR